MCAGAAYTEAGLSSEPRPSSAAAQLAIEYHRHIRSQAALSAAYLHFQQKGETTAAHPKAKQSTEGAAALNCFRVHPGNLSRHFNAATVHSARTCHMHLKSMKETQSARVETTLFHKYGT